MDERENEGPEFDFEEAANLCGLSGLQREFARAKLRGANNTQAARAAGYSGNEEQLRSAGHRAYKSSKVQSFLALAQREGHGLSDEPLGLEELERTLSKHVRGDNPQTSIRAAEVLHRIRREEVQEEETCADPHTLLEELAKDHPVLAILMTKFFGLRFPSYQEAHKAAGAQGWVPCPTCGELYRPRPAQAAVMDAMTGANGAAHG